MTREEAINILNRDDDSMRSGYFCINDFLAIEVLKSEEPILDKVRAEIEQQERWLLQAGYNEYNVDIAFHAIRRSLKGE